MSGDIKMTFSPSFYQKVNPENLKKSIDEALEEIIGKTQEACEDECPVRTGNLRDSHSHTVSDNGAEIHNSAEYWMYVVYGTSTQEANNYISRASEKVLSGNTIEEAVEEKLKKKGIIE